MIGNKARRGCALGIAVGIAVLVILMLAGGVGALSNDGGGRYGQETGWK